MRQAALLLTWSVFRVFVSSGLKITDRGCWINLYLTDDKINSLDWIKKLGFSSANIFFAVLWIPPESKSIWKKLEVILRESNWVSIYLQEYIQFSQSSSNCSNTCFSVISNAYWTKPQALKAIAFKAKWLCSSARISGKTARNPCTFRWNAPAFQRKYAL